MLGFGFSCSCGKQFNVEHDNEYAAAEAAGRAGWCLTIHGNICCLQCRPERDYSLLYDHTKPLPDYLLADWLAQDIQTAWRLDPEWASKHLVRAS